MTQAVGGLRTLLPALGSVVLIACGPSVDVSSGGSGGSPSSGGSSSSSSSTSTSSSGDESSTGEPQFEGPGCGEPSVCDRGTFDGHVRIESAEDLAAVAGFTEVTGILEIMNSQHLVCLDALACLEVVGRDVRIQDNAALRSTEGLSALREIGEAPGGGGDWSGDIVIAHNAVLERLAGFSVQEVFRQVVISENPSLRTVSGFRELRDVPSLWVTHNPSLESVVGLRGIEEVYGCYVSFNESLCSTEVLEVCIAGQQHALGAAVQNDPSCPVVSGGRLGELPERPRCSQAADDCPLGQKCMPVSTDGDGHPDVQECRPVVSEPGESGEACSILGEEGSGLDTCERHSLCRNGVCVPMCLGTYEYGVCVSAEARCEIIQGAVFLCEWKCDPLAQNCPADQGCYPIDNGFSCGPSGAKGPAASCDFINDCNSGLTCVNLDVRPSDCLEDSVGCCTEVCDVTEPDCPGDLECVGWWDDYPLLLPRHLENVGICVDPS